MERWLTAMEVAQALGIRRARVYELVKEGLLETHYFGFSLRFRVEEIRRYKERKAEASAQGKCLDFSSFKSSDHYGDMMNHVTSERLAGKSVSQIAEETGLPRTWVSDCLACMDLLHNHRVGWGQYKTNRYHIAQIDQRTMTAEYEAGMSTTDLGERYEINPATVSRILRANGVVLRGRGGANHVKKSRSQGNAQLSLTGSPGLVARRPGEREGCRE